MKYRLPPPPRRQLSFLRASPFILTMKLAPKPPLLSDSFTEQRVDAMGPGPISWSTLFVGLSIRLSFG